MIICTNKLIIIYYLTDNIEKNSNLLLKLESSKFPLSDDKYTTNKSLLVYDKKT